MNEAIAMYDAGERRTIGRMMVNHSASVFATEKVSWWGMGCPTEAGAAGMPGPMNDRHRLKRFNDTFDFS